MNDLIHQYYVMQSQKQDVSVISAQDATGAKKKDHTYAPSYDSQRSNDRENA